MTVRHVVENAAALDGRDIVVRGWIEDCQPLSCIFFGSMADMRKERAYFLSIGPSDRFDAVMRRRAPTGLTLRAGVHDRCISNPGTGAIAACTDRATTLEPLGVVE